MLLSYIECHPTPQPISLTAASSLPDVSLAIPVCGSVELLDSIIARQETNMQICFCSNLPFWNHFCNKLQPTIYQLTTWRPFSFYPVIVQDFAYPSSLLDRGFMRGWGYPWRTMAAWLHNKLKSTHVSSTSAHQLSLPLHNFFVLKKCKRLPC